MLLAGKRVLVVEDEMLVAMNLQDSLEDLGAIVIGPAMRLDTAMELAAHTLFDVAVLDVNLHGGRSYPVAQILRQRALPFIFATGYGHAEEGSDFRDVPTLAKPYRDSELAAALARALAAA